MTRTEPLISERPHQPFYPTRITNIVGRLWGCPTLNPKELMDAAVRTARLSDWGDEPFREALEAYCQAVNEDRQMHCAGRLFTRRGLEKWLVDRLQIRHTIRTEPAILDRPIKSPILIPGTPRAGTTLLHRLMALDRQFRTAQSWEIHFPVPPPEPDRYDNDPRVERADKLYRKIFRTSPFLEHAHPMGARLAEECWYLLDRALIRPWPALYHDVPLYREWLSSRTAEEIVEAYRYHRKQLQLLQWRFPHVRWLLKSPVHGMMLRAFHEVYPDATYIFCHREPTEVVPSLCSLTAARKAAFYDRIDMASLGGEVTAFVAKGINGAMQAREQIPAKRCLDVSFRALVKEPIETVMDIYRRLGLQLTAGSRSRMESFLIDQRRGKHLNHTYTAAQYGLEAQAIHGAFEHYRSRFRDFF